MNKFYNFEYNEYVVKKLQQILKWRVDMSKMILRNEEEYPTTVQTVLGLCYGLQLSVPEAEMLVGKTDFNIKPTNPQNNAYRCVLSSCAENSIYEVNEMLESCGFEPLGSSKLG